MSRSVCGGRGGGVDAAVMGIHHYAVRTARGLIIHQPKGIVEQGHRFPEDKHASSGSPQLRWPAEGPVSCHASAISAAVPRGSMTVEEGIHLAGNEGKQQFPSAEAGTRGTKSLKVEGGLEEAALLQVGLLKGLLGKREVEPLVSLLVGDEVVPGAQLRAEFPACDKSPVLPDRDVHELGPRQGDVASPAGDAGIVAQPLSGDGKRLSRSSCLREQPAGEPAGAPHEDPDAAVPAEKDAAAGPHAEGTGALRTGQRAEDLLFGGRRAGQRGVRVAAPRELPAASGPPQVGPSEPSA